MYRVKKEVFVRKFNDKDFVSKDLKSRYVETSIGKKAFDTNIQSSQKEKKTALRQLDWILVNGFHGVCQILTFKNLDSKTRSKAAVGKEVQLKDDNKSTTGMLLNYFVVLDDGTLEDINYHDEIIFVPIIEYKFHIQNPEAHNTYSSVKLKLSSEVLGLISDEVKYNLQPFAPNFAKPKKSKVEKDPDFVSPGTSKKEKKSADKNPTKVQKEARSKKSQDSDEDLEEKALKRIAKGTQSRRKR